MKAQDNPQIRHQPFPEPIPEELEIHANDNAPHQHEVKYRSRLSSHLEPSSLKV
jgi:hypothetical protein